MTRRGIKLLKKMKKNFVYAMGVIAALCACESNETREIVKAADPVEPVVINNTTTTKLEKVDEGVQSGMGSGYAWTTFNGVFITETPDLSADDPTSILREETKVGGISASYGKVLKDTIACGEAFIDPIFTISGEPTTTDLSTSDSIAARTTTVYTGSDGEILNLDDLYAYLNANVTIAVPHYEPSSSISGIRYEPGTDENSRVVWIQVRVDQKVVGTTQGTAFSQTYEVGYTQVKNAAVEPEKDPYEVRIKSFDLFRTYRKKTQHSICEGVMAFAVYNSRTGELVEEISTDDFAMQLAKCGHFGSPSNGYIVGEARLIGSAPTSVTEKVVPDNEEALTACHEKGNFKVVVTCTAQDYYVNFPVRGRDDSEGGMEAGGQNLFFQAEITYTSPDGAWTKTWKFTHTTEVNVKGWENATPAVDRSSETVNDVDGQRKLNYAGTFVVEFVNHLYLDGEEVVQVVGDDDYYHVVSKASGTFVPFHTSDMRIDCWTSYLP